MNITLLSMQSQYQPNSGQHFLGNSRPFARQHLPTTTRRSGLDLDMVLDRNLSSGTIFSTTTDDAERELTGLRLGNGLRMRSPRKLAAAPWVP